jgi:predicted MPP superfamily phosphohydrolase
MERLERIPELVLSTGDMIDTNSGIEPLLEVLAPLEVSWGKFYVNGSHDYFQARFMTYRKYFGEVEREAMVPSDFGRLKAGLDRLGWTSLTNRQEVIETSLGTVRLSGVDDPYLKRDDTTHLATERSDALSIGLMHSPDVVAEFALAGFDLMVAGHTHGGQVRFPFVGAVVTNSSLPTELAMGLNRVGSSWIHVSPGLGHGTFSPIRFLTRPEATLLRLVPGR